ncbi:ABC transporter substrate-binding protein [Thalassotalea euphylliae]|uniref:ABC transporter substrate-binding protein n=1 Tax=Thalassotalea euphylliae TaxID=1655234 RepID=UPI0015F29354|nr:ABC transporter substrate-binding protein [Thalassotalea euphylliae]
MLHINILTRQVARLYWYVLLLLLCVSVNASASSLVFSKEANEQARKNGDSLVQDKLSIALILPQAAEHGFWRIVEDVAFAVAADLDINIQTYSSVESRFSLLATVSHLLRQDKRPDYVIIRPYQGNAKSLFDLLNQANVKFITLEDTDFDNQDGIIKYPTESYPNWIGEVVYDNQQGSQLLLDALMREHQNAYPNKPINVVGLGGNFNSVSKQREQILMDMDAKQKLQLKQVFSTNWDKQVAQDKLPEILRRYPQARLIWCANDDLALTAYQLASNQQSQPYFIGGFDWLPGAIDSIEQGKLTASVGGHFLMAGQAVLRIAQHQLAENPQRYQGALEKYSFELITQTNVRQFSRFIKRKGWQSLSYQRYLYHGVGLAPQRLSITSMLNLYNELPK